MSLPAVGIIPLLTETYVPDRFAGAPCRRDAMYCEPCFTEVPPELLILGRIEGIEAVEEGIVVGGHLSSASGDTCFYPDLVRDASERHGVAGVPGGPLRNEQPVPEASPPRPGVAQRMLWQVSSSRETGSLFIPVTRWTAGNPTECVVFEDPHTLDALLSAPADCLALSRSVIARPF